MLRYHTIGKAGRQNGEAKQGGKTRMKGIVGIQDDMTGR